MSVATTIAALQALHAAVPGIRSAPTKYPGSLKTAQLPLVLVRPGPAQHSQLVAGRTLSVHMRDYLVHVFCAPVAQGMPVESTMQAVINYLDRFRDLYTTTAVLSNGAVLDAELGSISDNGGIPAIEYADGIAYAGIEFRVRIYEYQE